MEKKTIRLIVPDWQAGDNPVYYFNAKILQVIAPKKEGQKDYLKVVKKKKEKVLVI